MDKEDIKMKKFLLVIGGFFATMFMVMASMIKKNDISRKDNK